MMKILVNGKPIKARFGMVQLVQVSTVPPHTVLIGHQKGPGMQPLFYIAKTIAGVWSATKTGDQSDLEPLVVIEIVEDAEDAEDETKSKKKTTKGKRLS